jgi:hypothetical protein
MNIVQVKISKILPPKLAQQILKQLPLPLLNLMHLLIIPTHPINPIIPRLELMKHLKSIPRK